MFYRYPYYRNNLPPISSMPKPPSEENIRKPPLPPPPPPLVLPPKKKKFKKIDIKEFKKNTCKSLTDVECFLCDFNSLIKYIKLYKFFKK